MQVNAQEYLRLMEKAGTLAFFDTEGFGFDADYGSLLCATVKPYGGEAKTFKAERPGNDRKLIIDLKKHLESFDAWCGFYSKGHDIKYINSRALRYGIKPVEKRPHIDLYFVLKSHLATSRKSQAHLLSWLECPEQKLSVSAESWNRIKYDFKKEMKIMEARCLSDVNGLLNLYERTKHIITDITR